MVCPARPERFEHVAFGPAARVRHHADDDAEDDDTAISVARETLARQANVRGDGLRQETAAAIRRDEVRS